MITVAWALQLLKVVPSVVAAAPEFKRLYEKNHAPLLREMQKAGFIRSMRVDEPFTHLAGGPRWDLRVTIVSGLLAMAAGPVGFILLIATAIIT